MLNEILESIKLRLSIDNDSQDALLTDVLNSAFIDISNKLFGDYSTVTDLPLKYQEVAKNAVTIFYNQQGAEGQSTVSSDSISQSFNYDDMYDYIKAKMPNKPIV